MPTTRRSVLKHALATVVAAPAFGAVGVPPLTRTASAQTEAPGDAWRHGLSLFGDLKYPADFKHFDYVNPNAPKGGVARMIAFGTFDNFNMVVAGVRGSLAAGIDLIYDTLTVSALDEVSTEYGLLAEVGQSSAGLLLGDLSAAAGGPLARRQAGDARGRHFLVRELQEASPAALGLLPARGEGGEDRRARDHVHLRCARQSRTAADRRPAQHHCRSIGGRAPTSPARSATSA